MPPLLDMSVETFCTTMKHNQSVKHSIRIHQANKTTRNWFRLHILSTPLSWRPFSPFCSFFLVEGIFTENPDSQKQQQCQWSPTLRRVAKELMSPHEFIVVLALMGSGGCRSLRESCRDLNCWVFTVAVAGGSGSPAAPVCAVVNRGVCNILLLLLQQGVMMIRTFSLWWYSVYFKNIRFCVTDMFLPEWGFSLPADETQTPFAPQQPPVDAILYNNLVFPMCRDFLPIYIRFCRFWPTLFTLWLFVRAEAPERRI